KLHGQAEVQGNALKQVELRCAEAEADMHKTIREKVEEIEKLRKECGLGREGLHNAEVKAAALQAQVTAHAAVELQYAELEAKTNKTLREKASEIENLKRECEVQREGMHKAKVKAAGLQEQVSSFSASLQQTQGRYGDLRVRPPHLQR
ncbi:hypothetical protein C0991_009467, partial [Blastosporella zonata]